jgi:hypothetical protein
MPFSGSPIGLRTVPPEIVESRSRLSGFAATDLGRLGLCLQPRSAQISIPDFNRIGPLSGSLALFRSHGSPSA